MSSELAALVMAHVTNPEPDLSALTSSPPQKRKRPGEASPDVRRSKRHNMASPDATDAYTNNPMDTAQAAAAGVNVSDFNALQQAAAGGDHADAADPANASSTAAAALVYPTIHAPQPSEESFAAQVTGGDGDQHNMDLVPYTHDVSQADGLPMDHQALANVPTPHQPPDPGMRQMDEIPGVRYSTTPNPKPAVGSEEWHKMRKDNHKEGKVPCDPLSAMQPT
jgi:transcriptional regulator CBF1